VGVSFVVFLCLEIAAFKWLLLGRVKAGRYQVHSWFYWRKWFVDQLLDLSLDFLGPLYASVYLAPWYRMLGAKLGRMAEVSTASFISPDLLTIGDESFVADAVSLGAARIEHGFITIAETRIGHRTFVGNSAMLPPGTVLGDNALVGCLSAPPANPADALKDGAAWLGSPAIFLPQRQQSTAFALETTFKPSRRLRTLRAVIEFFRVILPPTGYIVITSLLFSWIVLLQEDFYLHEMLLMFPFLYAAAGALSAVTMVVLKWLLVGRYKPCEKPLWNAFVWRNELLNALQEHLANNFIIGVLEGTPFICWYFQSLGAKIGRRVYLETTDMTEFDLVRLGDEATVNADVTLQTHLFEDRVMKMSTVEIGARCCVGGNSLVLYDTQMEDRATLDNLSLLMKGEVLPADTYWRGIPARRAGEG
jgi:non-ribosomal peptide synthetase-like protein